MAETAPVRLGVDNVSVVFGSLKALDSVTLSIGLGEILGLIGPNGSGKTTLVNVVSGFQRPTSGAVRIGGRDITATSPEGRAAVGLGRTFQAVRLFGRMTVRENVEIGALGVGASPRVARERSAQLTDQLGLSDVADIQASALPYGLERRVALARAMAGEPKFLLLDEPAAGLDEAETDDLVAALLDVRQSTGCGLVVIEHDMRLITKICDRVHVLAAGRTLADGSPHDVVTDPRVIEAYLGNGTIDVEA